MAAVTAKVFQAGNSQALRLPKAFRLKSSTVKLIRTADGFSVYDEQARASRIRAFAALGGSCPGFPEVAGNQAPKIKRDRE
ncbi:MAG: antitoxin [Opitutaceae bacterium]